MNNEEYFNEKLNLDDLYKQQKITEDHKLKIYQKILTRIHNKIKYTSRMRNNSKFCVYVLPEFILGVPRYDINNCTMYVINKLSDNGFQVKYTHPNLLWISWQHYIPHYERANIKKKYGVSIDGFGNVIKKSDKKKDTNSLLLKDKEPSLKSILKKDKDKDFKKISSYKPTGNLIYNTKLLETIENKVIHTNK
tara:strand:- start:743 stop:1321 length:579 start_codon:yes stop_codon:yes gene_type:complete